jgi:hypothetical protein
VTISYTPGTGASAGPPPGQTPAQQDPPPPAPADTQPPETAIGKHPSKTTRSRKAKFTFSSSEPGASFRCKLDNKAVKACRSPFATNVKPGKHKLAVQAVDPAGNVDPTPATFRWRALR